MLTGVRCKWRPEIRDAGAVDGVVTVPECSACSASGANPCGYPLPFIKLMTRNRDPEVVSCSATMFGGCYREHGLKLNEDYSIDPDEAYTRAFGSLVHLGAETLHEGAGAAGTQVEARFARVLHLDDGRTLRVTAAMDILHLSPDGQTAQIKDYKAVDSISYSAIARRLDHHVPQFSIQRWILAAHGITVTDIELIFLHHKGKRNINLYPEGEPEFPNAYIMSLEKTEAYLRERGPRLLDNLAQRYSPVLTDPRETWRCVRCDVRRECAQLATKSAT